MKLTQGQLADKILVSPKAISRWETGEGLPGISNLNELAKLFKVPVDYILNGGGEVDSTPNDAEQTEENTTDVTEERLDEILEKEEIEKTPSEDLVKNETKKVQNKNNADISQNTIAIVALVLAGVSFICNFIFVPFIGIALAIVGLCLANAGKKEINLDEKSLRLYKLARLLNIIFIVLAGVWMLVLIILTVSYGFNIWGMI